MNVPNATPAIPGVPATTALSGVSQPASTTGGLADLFAVLLASLQGTAAGAATQVVGTTVVVDTPDATEEGACEECAESTADSGDIEVSVAEAPTESGEPESNEATGAINVAAAVLAALPEIPVVAEEAAVEANGNGAGSPDPPGPANVPVQARAASTPSIVHVAQADVPAVIPPPGAATPDNATPAQSASNAPHAVTTTIGSVVVQAVRDAQAQADASDSPPGHTLRELVRDATVIAREASAPATAAADDDGPEHPALTPVLRQASESLPENRPVAADPAAKLATHTVAQVASASGGDASSPDAVTTHTRGPTRADLPQSVDVRDVGNVTVRSVRYLSGRTDDTVTVRLVPRSLGELQIAVRTGADGLDVVLTAASHAARDRLDGQIVGLRDALARDGIDVNRVTVQAPPTFDLSGQMPSHQHHQSQTANAPRFTAHAFREPETNPSEQHEPSTGRTQHDGGLNMLA